MLTRRELDATLTASEMEADHAIITPATCLNYAEALNCIEAALFSLPEHKQHWLGYLLQQLEQNNVEYCVRMYDLTNAILTDAPVEMQKQLMSTLSVCVTQGQSTNDYLEISALADVCRIKQDGSLQAFKLTYQYNVHPVL